MAEEASNKEKVEIKFFDSMAANRRNPDFAYLRKNILVPITSPGLYPSKDFYQSAPTNIEGDIVNILGQDRDDFNIKVITAEGSTTRFYNLGSEGESNDAIEDSPYRASAFGIDGTYAATLDGKVYRAEDSSSATTEVGDLGSSWSLELGAWDDLYYWWIAPSQGIYRQLPGENPLQIFNGTITGLRGVDFYNNYMIIFCQIGRDVIVLWWDKADNSLFFKRVKIKNSVFLSGGVVDGRLMLVHFVGNATNRKELAGEIVVSAWDGENFTRLNSIRAGTPNLSIISSSSSRQISFSTGAEIMEFAVDNNISDHNPDLYDNYIYRIKKDGRIEVRARPNTEEASIDRASFVRVFHDFSLYTVNSPWAIFINRDTETGYDEYTDFHTSEYITNFIGHPYNDHKLDGVNISFEKLFQVDAPSIMPIPGSAGALATDNVSSSDLDLLWTEATSYYFEQNELEYKVYMSESNNIATIADMIANGTMLQDWTANISSFNVSGLEVLTQYYFNIIVRDPDGNEVAYVMTSATTTPLSTPWMSPTASADVELFAAPLAAWSNKSNAYAEDGSFATADQGDESFACYYDFDMGVPGGATILGFEIRLKGKTTSNPAGTARFLIRPLKTATSPADYVDGIVDGTRQSDLLTGSNAFYLLGASGDMLGTTWTPAEVNDPGFGFFISGNTSSGGPDTNYSLDHFEVRAFYST